MKYSNYILSVLLILTLVIGWLFRIRTSEFMYNQLTGLKSTNKVWVDHRKALYEQRDSNIRELMKKYLDQKLFQALDSFLLLKYKGQLFLIDNNQRERLNFDDMNIEFDQLTPVEVKSIASGARAKFVSYKISPRKILSDPSEISIELEIDNKKAWMSFINFEKLFVYPHKNTNGLFNVQVPYDNYKTICTKEKLYTFSNIELIIEKKDRVIQYMKTQSELFRKIVGAYYYDTGKDDITLCYAIKIENEDELSTLKANLRIALKKYRLLKENEKDF